MKTHLCAAKMKTDTCRSLVDIWFHHQLLGPVRLQPLHERVLSSPGTTGIYRDMFGVPPDSSII